MAAEIAHEPFEQKFKELKKEVAALERKEAWLAKSLSNLERTMTDSVRNLERTVQTLQREVADRDRRLHELKQSEKKIKEYQRLVPSTFASVRDALFILKIDKDGATVIEECNPASSEMFGFTREELVGRSTDFLHVDGSALEEFRKSLRAASKQKGYLSEFQFKMKRKDGTIFHTEHSVVPMKDEDGIELGWVSMVRDVSERKRVEEALRESEKKYRLLVENASDAIFVTQDGRIPFANRRSEDILGYTVDELQEVAIGDWIHPADRKTVLARYWRRLKGEQPPTNYAFRIIRKGGEERWGLINSVLIEWEGRPATLSFVADITEQRRVQHQLQQAQKMEALGAMVAGLAHEINNPVNCILINAPLIERVWEDLLPGIRDYAARNPKKTYGGLAFPFLEENLAQLISDMGLAADRIAKLVTELKNFAKRPEDVQKGPVDINRAVENAVKLSRSMIEKSGIELQLHYAQDLPMIEGHLESLEQILLNLVINSVQATHHQKGKIRLATDFQASTKKVSILVEDNGQGMDPSVAGRIFDPFFTTKQTEGGGGLGLTVTYNLVKQFNGDITFESRKDAGTVFKITFPAEKSEKMARILVVDDDAQIAGTLVEVLARHPSYILEAASDGIEALIKLGTFRPDVLILDIFMPGMDGIELCRKMRNEPSLSAVSVIIITGQIYDPRVEELKEMGFCEIHSKPFALEDIVNGVSQALMRKK